MCSEKAGRARERQVAARVRISGPIVTEGCLPHLGLPMGRFFECLSRGNLD